MSGKKKEQSLLSWERLNWEARIRGDRVRKPASAARRLAAPIAWATRRPGSTSPRFEIPEDRGFALFPPGTFPEAEGVVARAQDAFAAFDKQAVTDPNKDFFSPIVDVSTFTRDHPLVRLALNPDILDSVTHYLRCVPLIQDIMVRWSPAVAREAFRSSQLFHLDGEDTRQIKIFVLCSEVGPENGPLQLMDAVTSARVRDALGYQYRSRVTDEQVREILGEAKLTPVVGAPGTVGLVDPSRCFHFGSRVTQGADPRLVANVQYLRPFAFTLPRSVRRAAKFASLADPGNGRRERQVLGAA